MRATRERLDLLTVPIERSRSHSKLSLSDAVWVSCTLIVGGHGEYTMQMFLVNERRDLSIYYRQDRQAT